MAAIPIQCKLRYDHQFPAFIQNGAVHLSLFILKNPEIYYLVSQVISILFCISLTNPQKDQQPVPYMACLFPF